jgi:hypothetical protein
LGRRRAEGGVTVRALASPLLVGVAGLAISVVIALRVLIPNGMDPTIFIAFGEDAPVQTEYAVRLLGEVTTRHDLGHDGKFFFAQANDPWYLEPQQHAVVLDRPAYRGQRMLFPMIAGGFGLFPPGVVVWAMLVTNLLAMAVGAFLAAKLASSWGASPWLGLWVPLNIGLLFELDIGGAGILAYACCLGALHALLDDRTWLAGLLFAAAALSREVMVLFAVGVFVLWWLDRRERPWRLVVTPLVAMAVWYVYLHVRLSGVTGVGSGTQNFAPPFAGFLEAFRSWVEDPINLIYELPLLAVIIAFIPLAIRSRLPIAWGALPFIALATILSVNVWREPFDLSRALAPVFTAIPFLVVVPRSDRPLARSVHANEERA